MIDYLRSYYRHLRKQGINVLNDFELMANSLFDSNYYYSLLGELRNQAQHGQLLVSMYRTEAGELKACFDLEQLHRPRLYRMRDKSNCTACIHCYHRSAQQGNLRPLFPFSQMLYSTRV